MLSLGLKVLKGTALNAAIPSSRTKQPMRGHNSIKIIYRYPFRFSSLSKRNFCAIPSVSGEKYPIEADIDAHWEGNQSDALLFFDQSERVNAEMRFVPGEIFHDERLMASESAAENMDAVLASMESSSSTLDQFVLSLRRYAKTNQWERLEQIWNAQFDEERESHFQPNYQAYMLLMRSYAERDGKYGDAKQLLETINQNNISLTAEIYAYYILATVRDGHSESALNLFEEAKSKALKWQLHDIRVLMRSLNATNLDASQFISMIEPLVDSAILTTTEDGIEVSKPSKRTRHYQEAVKLEMFGIAVSKALSALDVDGASDYASKIINQTGKTIFTNTIAHVARWYIAKGQFKEARDFINHAVLKDRAFGSAGLQHPNMMPPRLSILLLDLSIQSAPRNQKKSATRAILPQFYALLDSYGPRDALSLSNFVLGALLTQGLYTELFEVATRVESSLGSSVSLTSVYNMKMRAHLYLNQWDEVVAQLAYMQDPDSVHKPNPHTSTVLVSLAAKHHGSAAARQLLEHIIESIGVPLIGAFRAVIGAYCFENRADLAFEVVQLMQRHGLRVTWALYIPIMEVYERLNLLGKQFALYHELLTQTLVNDVPSPEITTKLIFGCIRQGFIKVGLSVAHAVETHRVPLSLGLVASLVELFQHANMKDKLLHLAQLSESKMTSADGSSKQRVKFANLAIRAYSYCGSLDEGLNVFTTMKEKKLPMNVGTLNAILVLCLRQKKFRAARDLIANCEAEFGPIVASQAQKHPNTIAIMFSMAPASEWPQIKAKWQKMVEATRFRRAAAEARRASFLLPKSVEASHADLSAVELIGEMPLASTERVEVDLSEIDAVVSEFVSEDDEVVGDISAGPSSSIPEPHMGDYEGVPNVTTKLAQTILKLAHGRLSSESKWVLDDVLPACDAFGLPPSNLAYTVRAHAQIRLNLEIPLLQTLQAMYDAHVNMRREWYHSLIFEASKVTYYRHRLALAIFGFMTNRAGKTSESPNQQTWALLFTCLSPKLLGIYLKDYLDEGHLLDAQLQLSIARSLLLYQTPIDAAINDTFILIETMFASAQIIPNKFTLHTLLTAVMRPTALRVWKVHFYQLIARLRHVNALQWPEQEAKDAIQEALQHSLNIKAKRTKSTQEILKQRKIESGNITNDPTPSDKVQTPKKNKNTPALPEDLLGALAEAFKRDGVKSCKITLPRLQPYKLNLSPDRVPKSPKSYTGPVKTYIYPQTIPGYTCSMPNLPKPKKPIDTTLDAPPTTDDHAQS